MKTNTLREFKELRDNLVKYHEPSSGEDLLGMQIDFEHYLSNSGLVNSENLKIDTTTNKNELLVAKVSLKVGVNIKTAIEGFEKIWNGELRYVYMDAYFIEENAKGFIFYFVTQMRGGPQLYVTGKMIVNKFDPSTNSL